MQASLVSFELLVHAGSGCIGGIVTLACFFPLDSLRTRLQVGDPAALCASNDGGNALQVLLRLCRMEGLGALYRGMGAVLWTMAVSNFVYFYAYNGLKQSVLASLSVDVLPAVSNLIVATLAGVVNVVLTTPLWLVNTRMKVQSQAVKQLNHDSESQPYANLIEGLFRVCKEEGVTTLWDGTVPSLMLVSNPAIQWAVYEQAKYYLILWHTSRYDNVLVELASVEFFFLGAVAKTVATLLTYPLQVAQTRLRYNSGISSNEAGSAGTLRKRHSGTFACLCSAYAVSGIRGWYKGLEAKLWQTVLTAAFQLVVYERLVAALLHLRVWKQF